METVRFDELDLYPQVLRAIKEMGFEEATPIQSRAIPAVSQLGCSPCTLAIGIGRSQFEATSLMMEAMAKGDYGVQSDFEKTITDRVNESETGPLGLGGRTSVLATFAKVGPQRASGVRIGALRPCCCIEPRRSTIEI